MMSQQPQNRGTVYELSSLNGGLGFDLLIQSITRDQLLGRFPEDDYQWEEIQQGIIWLVNRQRGLDISIFVPEGMSIETAKEFLYEAIREGRQRLRDENE